MASLIGPSNALDVTRLNDRHAGNITIPEGGVDADMGRKQVLS